MKIHVRQIKNHKILISIDDDVAAKGKKRKGEEGRVAARCRY